MGTRFCQRWQQREKKGMEREQRRGERAMAAPDHHFRLVCRVEGGSQRVRERSSSLSSSLSAAREKGRMDARFCGAAEERGRDRERGREEGASFLEILCKNEEGEGGQRKLLGSSQGVYMLRCPSSLPIISLAHSLDCRLISNTSPPCSPQGPKTGCGGVGGDWGCSHRCCGQVLSRSPLNSFTDMF